MRIQQRPTFLLLALLAFAGCGTTGSENKRIDYKAAAIKTIPLEVPPDLTAPTSAGQFIIPDNDSNISVENGASFSQFSKEAATPTVSALSVLPVVKGMHIERSGRQRWLVVNDKAEKLWPTVQAFWQENGFTLPINNPAAGILETDFVENYGIVPQSGVRKMLGKIFSRMHIPGEKDMFRTRFEHTPEGHTEIYISHRGLIEQQNSNGNEPQWRARGNDPELEAAMLQLLAAKLGGFSPHQVADVAPVTPTPAGTVVEQPVIEKQLTSSAKLSETKSGGKIIMLQETFDKSWRKVGLALEQAAIEVHDKDRANGVYFLSTIKTTPPEKSWFESLAFWRAEDKPKTGAPPVRYQVTVRARNATDSEVSVVDQDGRTDDTTLKIIDSLFQQLSK